ncbi:hypothetical protein [Micromonospora sp. NPDC047074]|uniref:hypothetical protein n=1 Tax=Micromonospora sp. NPDC047074 TaxID=3154339 RepID=UPI0033D4D607
MLQEGDPATALRLANAELAERTAEFGTEHADTLTARRLLIPLYREALGPPAAIVEARRLTEDISRPLGRAGASYRPSDQPG